MLYLGKQQVLTDKQHSLYKGRMDLKALEKAIELAGSQAELARRLGKKQAHIWNWLHRDGRVPADMAIAIENAVDGQVTRHELRDDLYPEQGA